MSKRLICLSAIVVLLGPAAGLWAASPFDLLPTFDVEIGNDAQIGPGSSSETGSGMGMRNIATRRRVSFVTYDLSEIRGPGQVFQNVKFSNYGHDGGTVNVYGVLESVEHLVAPGITWNNAPGVKNDPVPALDTDVVLDLADLTDVLLTFAAPARGVREDTETSEALADFLTSDTNGFVAFLFAPEGSANAIVRTVEMGADGGTRLRGEVGGQPVAARDPNPADGATNVYRFEVLGWTPGDFATAHNVYLGTSFDDVNAAETDNPMDVLASLEQQDSLYDSAGDLAYGQTYFWRVDEVNGVDGTIYRGSVWSFTVEPVAYRIEGVTATASSTDEIASAANTVNGVGLADDLSHGTAEDTMWLSSSGGPQPAWIQYEFDRAYKLAEMWVWNYNVLVESIVGLGIKDVTIEYSLDGADWITLSDTQFARGQGTASYTHNTTVDFGGVAARYVRLTARSNWGGILQQYGLSEVRFFHIPTHARVPNPEAGQTGVDPEVVLQWRPGREAASHEVYFSEDQQAVADGTAPVQVTTEASFAPGSLLLATTYYWKVNEVNEVNEVMSPGRWEGPVWNFVTSDHLVVDDFESYTDDEGDRIYEFWVDGLTTQASGSQVGYDVAPFTERNTVHGGRQSMPLTYNNASFGNSEAETTFATPQDWTAHGVVTLSLYFYGPAENTAGQLYLKVNGARVAYTGPAEDLSAATWTPWTVDLASLGVNLQAIETLTIGVEGAGAVGTLFIDDIQLLP